MYFHWRLYLKALRISLLERPFRIRRWAAVAFFSVLLGIMWLLVAVGRALDHVFFPAFEDQEVREPVFIVAPPRSGTTLTQKLMAKDTERFSFVCLYHTIFPAVVFYKLFDAVAWLDARCGRCFSRFAEWIEKTFFGGWDDMHPLRFNEPEEDDGFFVYTFVTEAIYLLFPYVDELWGAGFLDDLPERDQRKVMAYYRSCLQRHLYATGPDKTLLSKATQFSGAIHSLRREFPDSKIVTIYRDPARSIASHVSVFAVVWKVLFPEMAKDSPESVAYARLAAKWFRHLHEARDTLHEYYLLPFRDLTSDPKAAILALYGQFGFEPSEAFLSELEKANVRQGNFQSAHTYTLEEFGLSEGWIREQLGDVIDSHAEASTQQPVH